MLCVVFLSKECYHTNKDPVSTELMNLLWEIYFKMLLTTLKISLNYIEECHIGYT